MVSFPLILFLRNILEPVRSLYLGFFIPFPLLFGNLPELALKHRQYPKLYGATHERNCPQKTKLYLHGLGNWEPDPVVNKFRKQGSEA
jgi:hypothetical protein